VIPNNSHFDTTRANIEYVGGIAANLLCKEGLDTSDESPFKGNMDIKLLKHCITGHGKEKIPFAMITETNNTGNGQAVFLDAKKMLPHIPPLQYPGIGILNTLYIEGGVRAVELGSVIFGQFDEDGNELTSPLELVRLAIPCRVYTQSHFEYLVEAIKEI
jgi:tryptophanase